MRTQRRSTINAASIDHLGTLCRKRELPPKLVEIDVADPSFSDAAIWMDRDVDIRLVLEELHPADPGELSGAVLRILGSGDYASICAAFGYHSVGYIEGRELMEFLEAAIDGARAHRAAGCPQASERDIVAAPLIDVSLRQYSGVSLVSIGESLAVWFGELHCCGVARGYTVVDFLQRAWLRAHDGLGADSGRVVSIASGWPARRRRCS